MIDLNKEAEEYAIDKCEGLNTPIKMYRENLIEGAKEDYIAGVNSKYVQSEKIKAQIEILGKTIDFLGQVNYTTTTALRYELKQQLKQLQNI